MADVAKIVIYILLVFTYSKEFECVKTPYTEMREKKINISSNDKENPSLKNDLTLKTAKEAQVIIRPNSGNISIFEENKTFDYIQNDDITVMRMKRESKKPENYEKLRKKLETEKFKKDDLMPADANARTENVSSIRKLANPQFGGVKTEQRGSKNNKFANNLKLLKKMTEEMDDKKKSAKSAECNFEDECGWQWKTDIPNGLFRTSPQNYSDGDVGPATDADDNNAGKFTNIFFLNFIKRSKKNLYIS